MNIQYKRAIVTMILFGTLFLFLVIDFAILGTEGFMNRTNFLATSLLIFVVMVVFMGIMFKTERSDSVVDERDTQIQTKATNIALILTTMFVFLFCLSLFLGYEDVGNVPVSWLWLLAYLTFSVAYFSTSTIIVLMYWKDNATE